MLLKSKMAIILAVGCIITVTISWKQLNTIYDEDKLWLLKYIGDIHMAEKVQLLIGGIKSKYLAQILESTFQNYSTRISYQNIDEPFIYIITPTYERLNQIPELTRFAQTLMHINNIYWIVVEHSQNKSKAIVELLKKFQISVIHLNACAYHFTNHRYRMNYCRNIAINWISNNVNEGIFLFGDEYHSYDVEIFSEIRQTKTASVWPVGYIPPIGFSSPVIRNGKYLEWINTRSKKTFPAEIAGFAVNIKYFKNKSNTNISLGADRADIGHEILKNLFHEPQELEFKAYNCTKVLVWRTDPVILRKIGKLNDEKYIGTNIIELDKLIPKV